MDGDGDLKLLVDPVIDKLTRDLRKAFKAVNREAESQAKAAEILAKKTAKRIRKRPDAATRKAAKARRAEAVEFLAHAAEKHLFCPECKVEVPPIDDDDFLPRLCRKCAERSAELSLGQRQRTGTQYTEVTILPGGAPGSGRRK